MLSYYYTIVDYYYYYLSKVCFPSPNPALETFEERQNLAFATAGDAFGFTCWAGALGALGAWGIQRFLDDPLIISNSEA